jgi:hypothetical protein
LHACSARDARLTRDATVRVKTDETSHDLQSLGDSLRVAPEGVVDETVEQIRRSSVSRGSALTVGRTVCTPGVPARSSNPVTL